MKLLINAGNLKSTGVVQVALSFLQECVSFPQHEYHVFVSTHLQKELEYLTFPSNFHFYLFDKHPLYSIFSKVGFSVLRRYHALEKEIQPDCVFTVFGPAWWKSKAPCIAGYGSSQFIYEDSPFWDTISLKDKLLLKFHKVMFFLALRREAQCFVTETNLIKERLPKFLKISPSNVVVVSNTCSAYFFNFVPQKSFLPPRKDNEFRLFFPAINSPHKNHKIINGIAEVLQQNYPDKNINFITTLESDFYNRFFTEIAKKYVTNIGRVAVQDCPQVFFECDALFLPTLLECFSASYPEAMRLKKTILTSNLPFAVDICKDAALYFDPCDASDAAQKIIFLAENLKLQKDLVAKGEKRLTFFLSPRQRAQKYLELCEKIITQNKIIRNDDM